MKANAGNMIEDDDKLFFKRIKKIPLGVAIIKAEGRLVEMANDKFLEIVDKQESELIGRPLFDVLSDEEQLMGSIIDGVLKNGFPHYFEEVPTFITQNGSTKESYLDYEYTPLFNSARQLTGVMLMLTDVTERVQARKKIENAEESTRLATEIGEIATWELNLQTHDITHSESLATMLGYPNEITLSYSQILSHINSEDLTNKVDTAFTVAMQTGTYKYEVRVAKLDGNPAWVRSHGKIFFDANGEPLKMIGTLIDITEERNRREILMESEQKFRLLADSMPQHIWTANALGKLNYYNQALFLFSGLSDAQLINSDWLQLVHPDERKKNKEAWIRAIHSGQDFITEHRLLRHDGTYRWQLSLVIPQKDAAGNIQMWVGTGTDIEEQKAFTTELEKQVSERTAELVLTNAGLVEMNIELQSFAHVSSHDLQEPMRKIQMITSRLLETEFETLSDYGKEYFKRLQKTANRMQELIADLLLYSSTSAQERIFIKTDLKELIDEVKYDFKEIIDEKNAIIETDFLPEVDVIRFQIKQLFHNMISNALKFTAPQRRLHMYIGAKIIKGSSAGIETLLPDSDYCHITIKDNGLGFDPKYKLRIFEIFKRLHVGPDYKGTGIGLAIVKKIVDNHKGAITASGAIDKGATFDIYLPMIA